MGMARRTWIAGAGLGVGATALRVRLVRRSGTAPFLSEYHEQVARI
jgi:hypothetical protein